MFAAKNTTTAPSPSSITNKGANSFIQPKLNVGKPGDKYEVEADKAADQIVAKSNESSTPFFPATPAIQKQSEEEVQKQEEDTIQEKPLAETLTPVVQLQTEEDIQEKCADCEAEEQMIQNSPFEKEQKSEENDVVQEKCETCGKEHTKIQRKEGSTFPALPEGVLDEKEEGEEGEEKKELPQEGAEKTPKKETKGGTLNDLAPPKQKEKEEIEMPPIQEKSMSSSKGNDISHSLSASKGSGGKMDTATLQEMNTGFGTDFSNVNIHTGSSAVQMNKDLGAQAFTNGNDVYFNEGKYNPQSTEGKHLLAHELTHTVQQGAVSNTVQQKTAWPEKTVSPEGKPERPNDGSVVEGKSNSKIDGDDNVKNQSDLSDEEKKEKKDPPRGEVRSERSSVQAEGVSTPPVDRGGQATAKIADQKQQMDEQLSAEPPAGESEKTPEGETANENLSPADAAEQKAQALLAQANSMPIPAKPKPFVHPTVIAPVDSAGQPLPRKGNIDTQVRGLAYIAEMLREKGYEMKQHATEKEVQAAGTEASIETSKKDVALSEEGTQKFEDQNTERKTISDTSKKALDESKSRQAFVAGAAPGLAQEADQGKGESGSLASEANSKASASKSKIPDDPDARADAEQQSGEMGETASGAQSMDDAITQTGERARQYIKDAAQASQDNQKSEGEITENDATIAQIDGKVAEFKAKNTASNAQIAASAGGPNIIRKQAAGNRAAGDQLIAATMVMEIELVAIQDEYIAGMAAIESQETAQKRVDEEAKTKQKQEATPEELKLFSIAALDEKDQDAEIAALTPAEKTGIMAALDKMISETPDDGTAETEGARKEVKLLPQDGGPQDPRQEQIDTVDNQRIQRVGGVMKIADQNMNHLSVEQQKMLAEKLVAESIVDDVKNISVAQMAKGMIQGMINPLEGLKGVVGGLEKTFSGVANIFNAEAWKKDPLGNLLQIGADISTGLAMVFSSILGIAGMITALMVALTIISWGTLTPITAPVIGWMGTIMTYAGWGAIISGSLSVYFNSLAYIKNLNDAGTAQTATELFGNVEQMKQNATDGMTGAMAIVEGVGAVKMGPVMKSGAFMKNVPKSPGAFARQTLDGAKEGLEAVAKMPSKIAAGAKKLFAGGKKGLQNFKKKIQGFFNKSNKVDIDVDVPNTKRHKDLLGESNTKKLDEMTPDQRRADLGETANNKPKQIDPDSEFHARYDVEIESNGHTYRRNRDGSGWCRFSSKECGIPESELPKKVQQDVADIEPTKTKDKKTDSDPDTTPDTTKDKTTDSDTDTTPDKKQDGNTDTTPETPTAPKKKTTKKHKEFEAEVDRRLKETKDKGLAKDHPDYMDDATAKKLKEYSQSTVDGPKRDMNKVVDDIKQGKVLDPDTSRFSDTPDSRKDFWKDEKNTKGLEQSGGGEIDVKGDKTFTDRKKQVQKEIKSVQKKNENFLEKSEQIDQIKDPVKRQEAIDSISEKHPEFKEFQAQREKSFADKHPDDKIRAEATKKFDQELGGTEFDTPENRQKAFEKEKAEAKKQHGEDFARAKTNSEKGDVFEDSRVADQPGSKKLTTGKGDQQTVTVNGKDMNIAPDIEVPGSPPKYIEMKSGPLNSLDAKTKDQILRYAALKKKLKTDITYELLEGASQNVKDFMTKHGIQYIDYTTI